MVRLLDSTASVLLLVHQLVAPANTDACKHNCGFQLLLAAGAKQYMWHSCKQTGATLQPVHFILGGRANRGLYCAACFACLRKSVHAQHTFE